MCIPSGGDKQKYEKTIKIALFIFIMVAMHCRNSKNMNMNMRIYMDSIIQMFSESNIITFSFVQISFSIFKQGYRQEEYTQMSHLLVNSAWFNLVKLNSISIKIINGLFVNIIIGLDIKRDIGSVWVYDFKKCDLK